METEQIFDPLTGEMKSVPVQRISSPKTTPAIVRPPTAEPGPDITQILERARADAKLKHNKLNHQAMGVATTLLYFPITVPLGFVYTQSSLFTSLNKAKYYYTSLTPAEQEIYRLAYEEMERSLRTKDVHGTQLCVGGVVVGLMLLLFSSF